MKNPGRARQMRNRRNLAGAGYFTPERRNTTVAGAVWIDFTVRLDEVMTVKRCLAFGGKMLLGFDCLAWQTQPAVSVVYTFGKEAFAALMSSRKSSQILSGISRNIFTIRGSNWRPAQSSISLRAASML
jgi:hypothetical protein